MPRRGLFIAIPALCLTLAARAPGDAPGDLDVTVQSDGLLGTVKYRLADGGKHFVWLRDDLKIDRAEIGGKAVTLLDRGPARERDSTRILALPDGAGTGVLSITFHGGARPGLNHYLGPDFAFSDAGTTAWFPVLDGQRRQYNITVRTLPGREASVSGVETARSVTSGGTTTRVSVGYPSFPAFAAGQFAQHAEGRAGAVGLGVDLSKPRDAKLALRRLAQLMTAEQEMFGAYPFSSFRLIEIPARAGIKANLTAGSYEGMFVIRSDYLDLRGFSLAMLGHEMAHQWWGNAVTLEGEEGDYLLDEAMAQYAAFETVERIEGAAAGACIRAGYDPARLGGMRQASLALAAAPRLALRALPHAPASYESAQNFGALSWTLAASMIGKQRFQAGLRRLARERRFRPLTFAQALDAIAGNRSRDRDVLQKIFSADHMPSGRLTWQQGNGIVDIAVLTKDTAGLAPPPVQIRFANRTGRWVVLMPTQDGYRGRYASRSPVRSVEVDPLVRTTWVPQGLADEAAALAPVTAMLRDWNYGEGDRARAAAERLAAAFYGGDPYAIRFRATIVLAEMIEEEGNPKAAIVLYQRALAEPSRAEDQVASTWRKLARAARAAGHEMLAEEAGRQADAANRIEAEQGNRCPTLQLLWSESGSATSLRPDSLHD